MKTDVRTEQGRVCQDVSVRVTLSSTGGICGTVQVTFISTDIT